MTLLPEVVVVASDEVDNEDDDDDDDEVRDGEEVIFGGSSGNFVKERYGSKYDRDGLDTVDLRSFLREADLDELTEEDKEEEQEEEGLSYTKMLLKGYVVVAGTMMSRRVRRKQCSIRFSRLGTRDTFVHGGCCCDFYLG